MPNFLAPSAHFFFFLLVYETSPQGFPGGHYSYNYVILLRQLLKAMPLTFLTEMQVYATLHVSYFLQFCQTLLQLLVLVQIQLFSNLRLNNNSDFIYAVRVQTSVRYYYVFIIVLITGTSSVLCTGKSSNRTNSSLSTELQ